MTRRDMIEQRRQRAPVLCPACYERAKAIRQTSIDHYSTCPACRQAYPVTVADKGGLRGRGAYLCRRRECLDRALQRRAFQRAFRASVVVALDDIATVLMTRSEEESDG